MTPDQARAVANAVGEQLKNEWKTTSKVIAAVPNNKRDYKPDPNGRSAWELATHMAGADVWFLDGVINGKFDSPDEKGDGCGPAGVAAYEREFQDRLNKALALPREAHPDRRLLWHEDAGST